MKVSVIGLGYVGCVSLGCLADKNHELIGVDILKSKVELINNGVSPIIEKGLDELIKKGVENKKIIAVTDLSTAIINSELCLVCVGTPNLPNGGLDMSIILSLAKQIGSLLKTLNKFFTISIRSTIMPGTIESFEKIIEKISGKKANVNFAVILNPEFLREGSAVKDFFNPPFTIVSGLSDIGRERNKELFNFLDAPIYEPEIKVAEIIKFLNNSFHALKVAFANEMGRFSKSFGINSHDLMNLFIKDTELNISPKYLIPGFSYGGSCLPKDLKALNYLAQDNCLDLPILKSIKLSNDEHNNFIFAKIQQKKITNIGFMGLAFKADTDDLRFSPCVDLCEKLIGKGYKVQIYDHNINLSKLIGQNKNYLLDHLPHINLLLTDDLDVLIKNNELIVFVHGANEDADRIISVNPSVLILDLVGNNSLKKLSNYDGIAW